MNRFYCPDLMLHNNSALIKGAEEIHHIKNVLKLKKGEKISLFDGKGKEIFGEIELIRENEVVVVVKEIKKEKQIGPKIILACAMPKRSQFEWIIEKATELGVDEIIALQTKRTETVLKSDRLDKKLDRFNKIIISASKQSKRSTLVKLSMPMDFKKALEYLNKSSVVIIPSLMGEQKNLIEVLNQNKSALAISFLIGPEGDFTPEEYQLAHQFGAIAVTLGQNILRVETAAISVLSAARLYFSQKQ